MPAHGLELSNRDAPHFVPSGVGDRKRLTLTVLEILDKPNTERVKTGTYCKTLNVQPPSKSEVVPGLTVQKVKHP